MKFLVVVAVGAWTMGFLAKDVRASDWIASKLAQKPEQTFEVARSFYDVERCIVYSSVHGWIYRTPDRPYETVWIEDGSARHILWRLTDLKTGIVKLDIFEGSGNLNADTKACFDARTPPLP